MYLNPPPYPPTSSNTLPKRDGACCPTGPEEVAAELPDSIQNSFYCHKLRITSGQHNKAYTDYLIQPSIRPTSS